MPITRSRSLSGGGDGERSGGDKRQRIPSADEDEERSRMATLRNDSQDVRTDCQSGSSSKSSQTVKLQISDLLDCPTCCFPFKKPIYQCDNGHLACSSCCKKLKKKCSFCKSPIGDIRCRAVENIIDATIVPCPNAKYGCKKTTSYGYRSSLHEKNLCVFTQCSCPLPDCNYVGSYENLKLHALAKHSNYDEEDDDNDPVPFVFNQSTIFPMDLGKHKMVVLQEEEKGDLFVVQAFDGSSDEGVYVTVSRIAPPGVSDVSCSLAKLDQFSTLKVGMVVKKIHKVVTREKEELEDDDDDFLLIPSRKLSSEYWKMEICIGRGYAYIHI